MKEETLRSEILSELRQMNATLRIRADHINPVTSYRSITDPSTLTPEQIERISRITREWDKEVIGTHGVERVEPVMCGIIMDK